MPAQVSVIGIGGVPEVQPGNDLAALVTEAATRQRTPLASGDVLVVSQKVVSKAEGRVVDLKSVTPSPFALEVARTWQKDPRHVEVVLREARRIVRMDQGIIITETHHGFRCANSGVDASNVPGEETVTLLPVHPDASAEAIRRGVRQLAAVDVAVIVSDTFGRPWREGAVNVAIGVAGLEPLVDYRGRLDTCGKRLQTTVIAVADELAAAAELVTGKLEKVPAALVRGYTFRPSPGGVGPLLREPSRDLFR
ncbi:MAG: coenzyme F420-0:L-glutamate ligase [Chloroflexi bacterium]|nr:coenzyme F420-0:L-glutamate ligase [Chloroflexota bacterium]